MNIANTPPTAVSRHAPEPRQTRGRAVLAHARSYGHGVRLGEHAHREAQLLFAARGVMQVTTPEGRWLVPPARAVWLPPRLVHAVDVLAEIEMRTLYLQHDWVGAHPEAMRLQRTFVVEVRPLLRELILAAFAAGAEELRLALLAEVAVYELVEAPDSVTFMPLPTDPRARRVADLVLADPAGAQSLEDLAQAAGASARTISRLFRMETELAFKMWRQRARVVAGIAALAAGTAPIKQVAAKMGFASMAAFGHAVRTVTGATPRSFLVASRRPSQD
jgi:AraC-like DNA-binding protein